MSDSSERYRDHAVPADAAERTQRTLDATPGLVGEPSDAERSRTLLATKAVRFAFDEPVDTPLAVRTAMVELVRRTRDGAP